MKNHLPQILSLKNFILPSWNEWYAGTHWRIRKDKAEEIHRLVVAEIKAQKIQPVARARLQFTIRVKGKRRRDIDNFAVKFIIDALVIAKILKDDDMAHMAGYSASGKMNCPENEVVVSIEPV